MMKVPVSIAGNEIEDEPVKKTCESRVDLLLVSFFFFYQIYLYWFSSPPHSPHPSPLSLPPDFPLLLTPPSPTSKDIHI